MEKKVIIYGLDGKEKTSMELPSIFSIKPRKDLISRVVNSIERNEKQPQGTDPMAGMRNTAKSWGSGYGVARAPRLKGSGYPTSRNAAFVPEAKSGRVAHPPRPEKVLNRKVNKKERRLALLGAISATSIPEIVKSRGHIIDKVPSFPLIVDDKIQTIKKTSEIIEIMENLGLYDDIQRAKSGRSIRAGKGKMRGRRYKRRKSILIVIDEDFGIYKSARNIPGVDIVNFKKLNCKDLAPGARMGRLTLWTQSSINRLNKMESEA